MTFSIFRRNP